MSASAPSVLIVLTGSLGDVARGTAIVAPLKKATPAWRVSWLVEERWRELLVLNSGIDELIVFKRSNGLRGVLDVKRQLTERHFDLALDLQRNFKSGIFSRWSGAARRIGFHRKDAKEFNWLFTTEQIPYYGSKISKLTHYLHFLGHLGISSPTVDFGYDHLDAEALVPLSLKGQGGFSIGLVLGSSWNSKNWFSTGYERLAEILRSQYPRAQLLLLGDKSQRHVAQNLMEKFSGDRLIDLVGQTSISQLVGILKKCAVVIGPDSGPGHIASLVRTPYVTLFGPTDPIRVAPHGGESLAITSSLGCMPCMRRDCPGLNRLCMRLISPEAVFEKVRTLIDQPC